MKKFLLVMMAAATVVLAGCSKDASSLEGTKWVGEAVGDDLSTMTLSLRFTSGYSCIFDVEIDGETGMVYSRYVYDAPNLSLYWFEDNELSPMMYGVVDKKTMSLYSYSNQTVTGVLTRQ